MGERSVLVVAEKTAKRHLVRAGILSFFVNILMLTGPIYMLQIYDRVLASRSYETLLVITLLTITLFAGMAIIDLARSALLARAGDSFEASLKDITFDLSMDGARLGSNAADQSLKDLHRIRQFLASPAVTAIFDAPWTPFFLGIIFLMHWLLGVVALLGAVILLVLAIVNERRSRVANEKAQGTNIVAERIAQASLRNVAAADAMGMRAPLRTHWRNLADHAGQASMTATDVISSFTAISKAARLFLQSAILGTGAYLAINNAITPGIMIAASIITGRALAPIEIVTAQWRNFSTTLVAYRRFKNVVSGIEEEAGRTELPAPLGTINVDRLVCRPGNAKDPVLKSVSFDISAGELIGIIGPSAAGKSTLGKALVGVEPALAGAVLIDGAKINQWNRDALGEHIGYLPQEVELFSGTAAQNIARFQNDVPSEVIITAGKAAGAHDMILSLENGYDTEIGDRGAYLSSGQRQRLGLARALFGEPALIVLDEPNSNLDAEGDAALLSALNGLKARRATCVVITHRPSAIASVDKLLVLSEGTIRAFGPREDVLKQLGQPNVTPIRRQQDARVTTGSSS